jgi:predicted RNA-binding Zn-ribbon protein involved in translation (DUF1610 family)
MRPVDETNVLVKAEVEKKVQCAKCGHLNHRGGKVCSECGAHLYVICHACRHHNRRVLDLCDKCGEPLHRSFLKRWLENILPKKTRVKPVHLLLLVLTVYLAYQIVIRLVD